MKSQRLGLYRIDIKYVRNLANVDDREMAVSPLFEDACELRCLHFQQFKKP